MVHIFLARPRFRSSLSCSDRNVLQKNKGSMNLTSSFEQNSIMTIYLLLVPCGSLESWVECQTSYNASCGIHNFLFADRYMYKRNQALVLQKFSCFLKPYKFW